jgi:hypothetical protein
MAEADHGSIRQDTRLDLLNLKSMPALEFESGSTSDFYRLDHMIVWNTQCKRGRQDVFAEQTGHIICHS